MILKRLFATIGRVCFGPPDTREYRCEFWGKRLDGSIVTSEGTSIGGSARAAATAAINAAGGYDEFEQLRVSVQFNPQEVNEQH